MPNKTLQVNSPGNWTDIISPQTSIFDLKLKEVWRYRDLLFLFVKRDFVSTYKQTILGPIWFFIQPLLTTLTFVVIFGNIAKLSTDGLPMTLFYMAGITMWNYFSDCLNKTATVFKDNAGIFGKVYFPRLIMPLSIVVSNLIRFGIQFLLFIICWAWFYFTTDSVHPNWFILLTPYLVLIMALLALGAGMIISAMTTKYRDLIFLLGFGIQLFMYATPVIYPMSSLSVKYGWIIRANPLSSIIETFRYAFTGSGQFSWGALAYSSVFTLVMLVMGTVIFNKVEKSFMDSV
ncbi:MAG: ABC transporter permease [Ferruginibacter sp.]|nr:ABC transporter permease [Ferruginibacter sp.]